MNNAMVAVNKSRGKSGKQLGSRERKELAAAQSIYNEEDIKNMTEKEINDLADMISA